MNESKNPLITDRNNEYIWKVGSALLYAFTSFLITISNKIVLTTYQFPSFNVLGIGQMLSTIFTLAVSKRFHVVHIVPFSRNTFIQMWPLQLIFFGNLIFGLGGTKELSLPMFTVLRRFSILMTMFGELVLLNVHQKLQVQFCVYAMVIGAIVAASHDLSFNLGGYVYVLFSDFFTAANGVYMKKKLVAKEFGKFSLIFYNAVFMVVPLIFLAWLLKDFELVLNFTSWSNPLFLLQFFLSCVLGSLLSYSIILCTFYNSALTTTIIGCLKNVIITYLGMLIGGDYIFSYLNFVGINISVIASIFYTYVTFKKSNTVTDQMSNEKSVENI